MVNNHRLPIHNDMSELDKIRLRSRNPSIKTAKELHGADFRLLDSSKEYWEDKCPSRFQGIPCITEKPPAFD
ncbi:hypothetical protein J437_LFUL018891 [Ladona fulva]|uniref:Uncharacterized protein n=1 Tax=Ladona fulva TaxID=123851 RepID=A0A8K0P8A4_LADFU|nr:hypothetical protein J437_LFUL018891 [Ladona fulva]